MRFGDILKLALSALWQQKVRTVLTTLGVLIGTFVLILSLSVGVGVRSAAMRQFRRHDRLRRIEVWPVWQSAENKIPPEELVIKGNMSDAKRRRLREAVIQLWNRTHSYGPRVALTQQRVGEMAKMPHVLSVLPSIQQQGEARLESRTELVRCSAAVPGDERLARRVVAGRPFTPAEPHAVLVSEFLLYRWGVRDDDQVRRAVGKTIHLEFRSGPGQPPNVLLYLLDAARPPDMSPKQVRILRKVIKQLPRALAGLDLKAEEKAALAKLLQEGKAGKGKKTETVLAGDFVIAGVFRGPNPEERQDRWQWDLGDGSEDLLLPLATAEDWLMRLPGYRETGYNRATVVVDDEDHVREVTDRLRATELGVFSLADLVERVQLNLLMISFALSFVALVALLVAVLGIINTMLMAVLERTREIGIMKAVGGRDGHIQLIFLLEGACIGLVGGSLGLLLSWLTSIPADRYARALMERQTQAPVEEALFVFPLWLVLGAPLLAALVTTLAAVLPARRAARVNPILALRHE